MIVTTYDFFDGLNECIIASTAIYDLKTGGAKMTSKELNNYKSNVPSSVQTIEEIKPL
jgi:hypothetical protein